MICHVIAWGILYTMASSCSGTWPPATAWKAVFRQHYSSSSFSKWHQLYNDTSCVLLGLKTALLVDYVSPDAKKLQLYLKDVANSIHGTGSKESTIQCTGITPAAECQFCRSMSDCCILTIGEDMLLVNMTCLIQDWGIDHDRDESKLVGHTLKPAQSMSSPASCGDGPVYIDVTKGLQEPKLVEDETKATLTRLFVQWLGTVQSSFQQNVNKTEQCIIPCHTKVSRISTQQLTVDRNVIIGFGPACGDVELNVCTLFGQLLGYPVVYWFNIERGYSMDMVELVCFTICVCKSDRSGTSSLNIDQVAD